jgi:hypothetical protein
MREADNFLIEVARWVTDEGLKEVDLVAAPSNRFRARGSQFSSQRMQEIRLVAQGWEEKGYGKFHWDGRPYFRFNQSGIDAAKTISKHRRRKSFKQRLREINWNAVNAVAALVAAIAAIAAAYFSYLALAKH